MIQKEDGDELKTLKPCQNDLLKTLTRTIQDESKLVSASDWTQKNNMEREEWSSDDVVKQCSPS